MKHFNETLKFHSEIHCLLHMEDILKENNLLNYPNQLYQKNINKIKVFIRVIIAINAKLAQFQEIDTIANIVLILIYVMNAIKKMDMSTK